MMERVNGKDSRWPEGLEGRKGELPPRGAGITRGEIERLGGTKSTTENSWQATTT